MGLGVVRVRCASDLLSTRVACWLGVRSTLSSVHDAGCAARGVLPMSGEC